MSKILVTGVNGFVGHHVAHELHEQGYEVVGASNQPEMQDDLTSVVDLYYGLDLTDSTQVKKMDLSQLDAIINLAGFASISTASGQQKLYDKVNVGVHAILYEECLRQNASPKIIAVSTGTVYDPTQQLPVTENSKLVNDNRANEYIISKKRMEVAVIELKQKGLDIVIARPFNHSGPGQLPGFLLPDLAEQIELAHEKDRPLKVGNLKTKRDYTDVRDVARAYTLLATSTLKHDVYNICSGQSIAGEQILQNLIEAYGFEDIETEVDPARLRKNDVMDIYGSHERLTQDTGWKPAIPVKDMVKDFVDWKKNQ